MKKVTKEILADALYQLLKEYSFEEITVNQIIQFSKISHSTYYRYFKNKQDLLTYLFHYRIAPSYFENMEECSYYDAAKRTIIYSRREKQFFKNVVIDSKNTFTNLLTNKYIQIMSKKLPKLTKTQYEILCIYLNGTMTTSIKWFLDDDSHSADDMIRLFDLAMPDILKRVFNKD